jgi:dGTPase
MHDPDDAKAGKKWAAYTTEDDDFRFARELSSSDELPNSGADQSLEAFIMDWADDITYAVHDVEDLYRAGLVPSERLHDSKTARRDFAERVHARWLSRGKQANIEDIDRALLVFPTLFGSSGPYDGTSSQRIAIRMFTSALIGRYVNWTRLEYSSSAGTWTMVIDQSARAEVDVLKELTWRYVIERPALASQQHGQKKVIRELFETFMDAARTPVIEQSTRRSSLLVSAMT